MQSDPTYMLQTRFKRFLTGKLRHFTSLALFFVTFCAHADASIWDRNCQKLMLTQEQVDGLFNSETLGVEALEYLFLLWQKVELQATGVFSLGAQFDSALRDQVRLVQFFQGAVSPLLNRFHDNVQLNATDLELSELAAEERQEIITLLRAHEDVLLNQLSGILIPGQNFPSTILEISRAHNHRLDVTTLSNLAKMYQAFAQQQGFTFQILASSFESDGSVRSMTLRIINPKAFRLFQYENGMHRFIRVGGPEANAANRNRTHTNYAEVRVYPEPAQREFVFNESEVTITTMRASGAGGQHVNTTDSAVRVRHGPTQIEVLISSERSQHQNKDLALQILRSKVFERYRQDARRVLGEARNSAHARSADEPWVRTYDSRYNPPALNAILSGNLLSILEGRAWSHLRLLLPTASDQLRLEIDRLNRN